jgi:excisionase family DNA binding protein
MEWLPIGVASRRLGVDPDTLRRWADSGRLESFTTPGGHRRFSSVALERLASQRSPSRERPSLRLGPSMGRIQNAYQRRYARPPATGLVSIVGRDQADREAFREAGRRLVEALVDVVDAGSDAQRWEAEAQARQGTLELAGLLAARSVGLPAAIEAFISARRPFLAEIARIGRGGNLTATEVGELYERSTVLLDRLVVIFAAAAAARSGEA